MNVVGIFICFIVAAAGIFCMEDNMKFDCYPEGNVNQTICEQRGCSWEGKQNNPSNVPQCFYGESYTSNYILKGKKVYGPNTEVSIRVNTTDFSKYPDPNVFSSPSLTFTDQTKNRLRVKIQDSGAKRFEVPVQDGFPKVNDASGKIYSYQFEDNPFSFKIFVQRPSQTVVIWDTSVGAMILANQFLQISTKLPSSFLYGIGENSRPSFKRDFSKWLSIGLYARGQAPYPDHNANLYGVHPFYLLMEPNGNAHGVLLLNSNAMDITLQPTPALTYRTTGGVLDFYFFFGPTPEDVVQQYTELIGRPVMPSYWSLGFQLCKWGYKDLDEVKETVERMSKYDIPQDVQYGDIDYMERMLDFTYDKKLYAGLPDYVREIKRKGIKYIIILDPAISAEEPAGTYQTYDLGTKLGVWIRDHTGKKPLLGKVWPQRQNVTIDPSWTRDDIIKYARANTTFPDWFHSKIESWWNELIKDFHKTIEFDGLWIDMNEVKNFVKGSVDGCPMDSKYETPPYKAKILEDLIDISICMTALHENNETEYNYHSLFGWKHSVITRKALTETIDKRGIVISRSTYPSSGKYAGHWLGDNKSDWPQMHESIIGMMDFSLFGIPYSGADICGFFKDTTVELCRRWTQLGAFYPMSRNHNALGMKPQDPAVFGKEFAEMSRAILHVRYTLLPYLYTLFYEAHVHGSTVVRPMYHVYPNDTQTYDVDEQFFWGKALLITPVLQQTVTRVTAYLPKSKDRWFDYYTGVEVPRSQIGVKSQWTIPLDKIGLHFQGGNVIPTQEPANNTKFSRQKPMGLIVALNQFHQTDGSVADGTLAYGNLFWDDGDALDSINGKKLLLLIFNATKHGLNIEVKVNGYAEANQLFFNHIKVLGLAGWKLKNVLVDGTKKFTLNTQNNDVTVLENLRLTINRPHDISWSVHKPTPNSSAMKKMPILYLMLISFVAMTT